MITMRESESIWRIARLFKLGVLGFMILALMVILFVPTSAFAEKPDNRPPDNRPPDRGGAPHVEQPVTVDVVSSSNAGALSLSGGNTLETVVGPQSQSVTLNLPEGYGAQANGNGDPVSVTTSPTMDVDSPVSVGGDETNFSTSNESNNFMIQRSMPMANGCWGGVDGGGAGKDFGGFLGIHILNVNCWLDNAAESEMEAEVRARLKCGAPMFRNAISFEYPKKERQAECVKFMENKYVAQIEWEKSYLMEQVRLGNVHLTGMNDQSEEDTSPK